MSTIALVALLLGIGASLALIAALIQVANPAGQSEDPVGDWSSSRPVSNTTVAVPREIRSLLAAERRAWHDPGTWAHLVKRLDDLETQLGGQPSFPPTPEYSAGWLESRLSSLEALAGPSPTRPNHDARDDARF